MENFGTPPPTARPRARGVGAAVDLPKSAIAPEAPAEAEEPAADARQDPRWGDEPVFIDQYAKDVELGLWRWAEQRTVVYNLLNPKEVEEWNKQQAFLAPEGSPRQVLTTDPTIVPMGDKLILVASFKRIEYNQVVPSTTFQQPKKA